MLKTEDESEASAANVDWPVRLGLNLPVSSCVSVVLANEQTIVATDAERTKSDHVGDRLFLPITSLETLVDSTS